MLDPVGWDAVGGEEMRQEQEEYQPSWRRCPVKKGARVRLSDEGRRVAGGRDPERVGTVVGHCYDDNCVRVSWEGHATSSYVALHLDFLEEIEDSTRGGNNA